MFKEDNEEVVEYKYHDDDKEEENLYLRKKIYVEGHVTGAKRICLLPFEPVWYYSLLLIAFFLSSRAILSFGQVKTLFEKSSVGK